MAFVSYDDAHITINSVDLSDHIKSFEMTYSYDELDTTTFGAAGKTRMAGMLDGSVSITFLQDYAAAQVEATIAPLLSTETTMVVRPDSAAASATNPQLTFKVLVKEWTPLGGAVGDLQEVSVSWPVTGGVTRVTA